jgi:lysine 2,3-aminomutase
LVVDAPGGGGKIPIMPQYLLKKEGKKVTLRNFRKQEFTYIEP